MRSSTILKSENKNRLKMIQGSLKFSLLFLLSPFVRDHQDSRGVWSLLLLLSMIASCGDGGFLLSEVQGVSWRQDIKGHDSHRSLKNKSKTN